MKVVDHAFICIFISIFCFVKDISGRVFREQYQTENVLNGDDGPAEEDVVLSRKKRAGVAYLLSAEEQQYVVDLHNDYRRMVDPEASNMEYMVRSMHFPFKYQLKTKRTKTIKHPALSVQEGRIYVPSCFCVCFEIKGTV